MDVESGWNLWVLLVGVVISRWVEGIYGYGYQEVDVVSMYSCG